MPTSPIFTVAQRHSLERLGGDYLNLTAGEADFTISDAISLGLLLWTESEKNERKDQKKVSYYKTAYSKLCGALKIADPEIFLVHLTNLAEMGPWNDFSDFKAVWYPKWFVNQISLRISLFAFANPEAHRVKPDFWGATCSDENVKRDLLAVRDSFAQIRVGVLAMVFKIDHAIAALLGWQSSRTPSISWKALQESFHFPKF